VRSQLMLEQSAGMLDLDRSLVRLVRDRLITLEEARFRVRSLEAFQNYMRSLPDADT
ncbi:MAG: hypothetical protein GTO30_06715, partial [Acidobacteria bacterium]|nr:hypothetical protein [Acidobacteriota bacterium]NIQ85687.1 hypothetical protein [Acidobacteriota bacterium]